MERLLIWIYGWFCTASEVCEKFGHIPGEWTETSGRGKYSTCQRCGDDLIEHEWS